MKNKLVALILITIFCSIYPPVTYCAINWNDFKVEIDRATLKTYPYCKCFERASRKYGVPILLLLSVAKGESNFNPKAVSHKDAIGVMQILWPDTASDLGFTKRKDLFDPCRNIDAGASYLSSLLKRYKGDIYLTLAAYYSGPNRVKKGSVPSYGDDYSHYIYSKLNSIRRIPYRRTVYAVIISFDKYFYARNFVTYIRKKDSAIPIEITKNALNEYVVNVSAGSNKEKRTFKRRIEKITGLTLR